MRNCSISIVIPVYNVKDYIDDCLASLPDEANIIFVNDGSTDGSDSSCRNFVLRHNNAIVIDKVNGGLSDARNAAMPYVNTEFVFFHDSDDRLDGSNLLEALQFAKDNELDWVQCGFVYDYGSYMLKHKDFRCSCLLEKSVVMSTLINDGNIKNFAWGKIYRSSIVKKFEFPIGKYYEDSYWQYKIIHSSEKFGIFPEIVSYYRTREGSISDKFSIRNYDLLCGLRERLGFIIEYYPELAHVCAANVWMLAGQFCRQAESLPQVERDKFIDFMHDLGQTYMPYIKDGMKTKSLLNRMLEKATSHEYRYAYKILTILSRISSRLSKSDYEVVKNSRNATTCV